MTSVFILLKILMQLVNINEKILGNYQLSYQIYINFPFRLSIENLNYFIPPARTTISQDVQTRFSVQLAFAKFLFKIKENF